MPKWLLIILTLFAAYLVVPRVLAALHPHRAAPAMGGSAL